MTPLSHSASLLVAAACTVVVVVLSNLVTAAPWELDRPDWPFRKSRASQPVDWRFLTAYDLPPDFETRILRKGQAVGEAHNIEWTGKKHGQKISKGETKAYFS